MCSFLDQLCAIYSLEGNCVCIWFRMLVEKKTLLSVSWVMLLGRTPGSWLFLHVLMFLGCGDLETGFLFFLYGHLPVGLF